MNCWCVCTVWSLERGDHEMIDDEEQNVDDVRPIKLDTIIPNKITLNITKLTNNNLSQSILNLISVSQSSLMSLIVITSPVLRMRMRAPCWGWECEPRVSCIMLWLRSGWLSALIMPGMQHEVAALIRVIWEFANGSSDPKITSKTRGTGDVSPAGQNTRN